MLRISIFQIISTDRSTKKIYRASSFSNRIVDLEYRARYEKNIRIYDIRREALIKANSKLLRIKHRQNTDLAKDNSYSTVERIKFAGYNNVDTFFDLYASKLSTVDRIASYQNKKRRIIYLKGFRRLSLYYYLQLL